MSITIHQPEHMPWLGFFHKLNMADTYVVLDNVQYRRRYFQNRNKINTKDGWQWICVPVIKEARNDLLIKDARIFKEDMEWREDNIKTIYQNYCKAKFFEFLWPEFKDTYCSEYARLSDLNIALIKLILKKLKVKKDIVFASELCVDGEKGDLILNICLVLGAKKYISGISGKEYLDIGKFNKGGVEVIFQEFHHPIYPQLYGSFSPCMSVIDLLFNCGPDSLNVINGIGIEVLNEVFL